MITKNTKLWYDGFPVAEWEVLKVRVKDHETKLYWATPFKGQTREAVRVKLIGYPEKFYDNEDGSALAVLATNRPVKFLRELIEPEKLSVISNPNRWHLQYDPLKNAQIVKASNDFWRKENPKEFERIFKQKARSNAARNVDDIISRFN